MLALAAIAWIFGAGSLIFFGVFLWRGSFGFADLHLSLSSLLMFDGTLCLIFFFQHSVLVRRGIQRTFSKVVPEHYWGIFYTITSAIALSLLVLLWQPSYVKVYTLQAPWSWVMRALLLLAIAGFIWGISSLKRFDAFGVDALLAHARGTEPEQVVLTIAGPYRHVRHPFYAMAILAIWATPVMTVDRLLMNTLFTAWIVVGAKLEERDLRTDFGDEYVRYQNQVPMLLPELFGSRMREERKRKAASGGRAA